MTITRDDEFCFTADNTSEVYIIERGILQTTSQDTSLKMLSSFNYVKYSNGLLHYYGYNYFFGTKTGTSMSGYRTRYYVDLPFPVTAWEWTNCDKQTLWTPTPPAFVDEPYIAVQILGSSNLLTPQLKWTKSTFTPSGASAGAWRTLRVWGPNSSIPEMCIYFHAWGHWTDTEVISVEI